MKGFVGDIEDQAEDNSDFRRVIYTGKNLQLVLMSLKPGEDIGEEVHKDRDQFFRIESFGDLYRRAAGQVRKILQGASPANLPVEQPTKFEFVLNMRTAKALGLTVSPQLLTRADEVIE